MVTKAIIEKRTGLVDENAYMYAVNKLEGIGFKVKFENETNAIILDRLSTYIDEYERKRKRAV